MRRCGPMNAGQLDRTNSVQDFWRRWLPHHDPQSEKGEADRHPKEKVFKAHAQPCRDQLPLPQPESFQVGESLDVSVACVGNSACYQAAAYSRGQKEAKRPKELPMNEPGSTRKEPEEAHHRCAQCRIQSDVKSCVGHKHFQLLEAVGIVLD